ncbi:MAG: hypothetical protein QW727_03475 [Candidatus Pacearchaeota archaeon]
MKKEIIVLLIVLFLFPLVSGIVTEVELHTLPAHDVIVTILEPQEKYVSLGSHVGRTGFDGIYSFNFSTDNYEVGVQVLVKRNGETISYGRLANFITGQKKVLYYLVDEKNKSLVQSNKEPMEIHERNRSLFEEENLNKSNVITDKNLSPVSGNVILDSNSFLEEYKSYLFALILIFVIGMFIFVIVKNHPRTQMMKAAMYTDDKPPIILIDKELEATEKKLRETERQLNEIKEKYAKKTFSNIKSERNLAEESQSDGVKHSGRIMDTNNKDGLNLSRDSFNFRK